MIAGAAIPSFAAGSGSGFTDVKETRWSYTSIAYAVSKGYMKGTAEGIFSPSSTLTRAMVVTVLFRREGSPDTYEWTNDDMEFMDVKESEWYTDAVKWATRTGVVNGLSDTSFGPMKDITREQLATMLFRYSSSAPVSVTERADLSAFPDGDKVSSWAKEAVAWAVSSGLIKGTDKGDIEPRGNATREQFAAIIERYDSTFRLEYNTPVLMSSYTEKEYPLVEDADVYVSVNGSDTASGTKEDPVATFAKAAELVKEIKKTKTEGDIKVAFMAGDYGPLSLELTAEDSGSPDQRIIYCKYGDGDVVFNNGFEYAPEDFSRISEEERSYFREEAADDIYKVDISEIFDSGIDTDGIVMYTEGGLCDEARFPDRAQDGTEDLRPAAVYNDDQSLKITWRVYQRRLESYNEHDFSTMKIWGWIIRGYRKDQFKVASYDPDTAVLQIEDWYNSEFKHMRNWSGVDGEGIEFCFTNVPRELDNALEYWIDKNTKTLYVYSPESTYHIPGGGTMIEMSEVNDVTFRGLDFRNAKGHWMHAYMSHGLTFELCRFDSTFNQKGLFIEDHSMERALDLTVRECEFSNAYGHALYVEGNNEGEHLFDKKENIIFDNNLVTTCNLLYDSWNGIHFSHCYGIKVTHNRFYRMSRGAVSFTGCYDILVEYNDFDKILLNSEDGGIIYTDWIVAARDLTVRYNYFSETPTVGTGRYGLYLDEFTSGFDIYSNLFYKTGNANAMFSLGRDNSYHDNVTVASNYNINVGFGAIPREQIDELGSYEAASNIWGIKHGLPAWKKLFDCVEQYPAYKAVIEEKWPDMLNIHFDPERIEDPYFALNQVTSARDNLTIDVLTDTDMKVVNDYGSGRIYVDTYIDYINNITYSAKVNPVFVNPTAGDYRIREGAEFPDIRFEQIGRY